MGSIASPPLIHQNQIPETRPIPAQPSILGQFADLMQIKNQQNQQAIQAQEAPLRQQALQQQVQGGQIDLQNAQQAQQDQQAFRTAVRDPANQGKMAGDIADSLLHSGKMSLNAWQQYKKTDIDQQVALAKLPGDQLNNAKAAHAATQELYNAAMNLPDDQLAANWGSIANQYDQIPGNNKQPLDPTKPMTKAQLQQFGPMISMQGAYIDDATARQQKQAELKKTQGASDPNSPFYAPSSASVALGTAPGAAAIKANEVAQAGRKAGAEESARMPGEMALARQKQALSQGDPNSAAQLLVSGDATLAELKSRGATPEFIANTLSAAHKLSGGQYNAQAADAQFDVAKSPANVVFFGSAKSLTDKGGTLDQLAQVAKSIPQNQIPAFNSIADWQKAATGSGPISKFASLALGVADDYSKVMGGGQGGSDTSRLQALKLISANQSPEQRAASVEGIRGAVNSQKSSRIGANPVLQRMYGDAPAGGGAAQAPIVQHSPSSGKYRYSTDGGKTWQMGQPPTQ